MASQIAAGSLFTSCVTNTEPQGIKDLREAKADYIESLSNLKKAEAEKVKAEAAIEQAKADYLQTKVEYQKIQNEIAQCTADSAKANLTVILKKKEAELKEAEKTLAQNEYELEKYLKHIALESKKLTREEQRAIDAYTRAYAEYLEAEQELRKVEAKMYDVNLGYANYLAYIQSENTAAALAVERWGEVMEALNDTLKLDSAFVEIEKFKKEWEVESAILEVEKANVQKEFNIFKVENVNESIRDFSKDLSAWFVKNVALPAPFHFAYKTQLPDNDIVVAAFTKYIDTWKLRSETNGFQIADGEIAANFNAAPIARKKIFGLSEYNDDPTDVRSLYNVVDALSRELVIDTNATAVDTVGLAKAVADAKDDYAKTKAALIAKVEAYGPVVDAKEALKDSNDALIAARAALTVAQNQYKADKDSLKAALENFVAVWNDIATDAPKKMGEGDTTNLWNAFKKVIVARYEIFGKDTYFSYLKPIVEGKELKWDTTKVNFTALERKDVSNEVDSALGGLTLLESAIQQFFNCKDDYLMKHFYQVDGYLTPISYEDLYSEPVTGGFATMCFGEYWINANFTIIPGGGGEYIPEAVADATDAVNAAVTAVKTAEQNVTTEYTKYYTDVYGKFWGIEPELDTIDATFVVKLHSSADSLEINFNEETFTEKPEIVKFKVTRKSYKKGVFNYDPTFNLNPNDELKIVWKQLCGNQEHKFESQGVSFGNLLFAKVLFKEAVKEEYTNWNADGVKEAIEALNDICDEFAAAYDAASEKQMKDSEPFFAFLEGLIGEDVLEEVFGRIDNAIATYNEYKPAVPGFDPVTFIIEQIAEGTISSREVVIAVFENLLCGEWSSKESKEAYESYAQTYVQFQVAAAFAGDQVEALLLDVLDKFVDALDIDIVSKDPGNIVEKLLFGTVNVGTFKNDGILKTAFNIVVPTITSYIVSDFGGIFGELTEKYFTEWEAAWNVYEQRIAEIQAQIDVYNDLETLYTAYETSITTALGVVSEKYESAFNTLKWTNAALDKIEAGADPYTLWFEIVTDWVEYWEKCVETAAVKLKAAEAAYNQVIKNHE